ncbi:DUF2255 family protein [Streptomyces sp. NPDC094034]|uniref:DUF2255 family protein n=1 Tax=Streptomyces sp. NPDC094034 TaxID=3155309 RepID=UPI00331F33F8
MTSWTSDDLSGPADAQELILTVAHDGETPTGQVELGFVLVSGDLYIRAFRGTRSTWFRQARRIGEGRIEVGGRTLPVSIEPADPALSDAIDAAYRSRFGMMAGLVLNSAAQVATLKLTPR